MIIRVIEKSGAEAPSDERDGTQLWCGGYSSIDPTEDALPASLLADMTKSSINVGTWYSYHDFKNAIASAESTPHEVWTALSLGNLAIDGETQLHLEAPAYRAVRVLATAVIRHFDRSGDQGCLWLRVE